MRDSLRELIKEISSERRRNDAGAPVPADRPASPGAVEPDPDSGHSEARHTTSDAANPPAAERPGEWSDHEHQWTECQARGFWRCVTCGRIQNWQDSDFFRFDRLHDLLGPESYA